MGEETAVTNAWKTAKDLLGINKNLSPTTILQNGDSISNPTKVADIFNNLFIQKVQTLRENTNSEPTVDPIERLHVFCLKPIDIETLRNIFKRIKGKRSHGIDNIDSFSIKLAVPLIEEALLHLINLSIEKCNFSNQWKPQLIFPLHKKGAKHEVKNYRPVSHLVEVGKMVEYAVYEQVVSHFTMNKLFHENHHGSLKEAIIIQNR